jgi:16S rRNA processing protein RimM
MNQDSLIIIGKIVAPHGVRGDVRVVPLTDFPERFYALKTAVLESGAVLTLEGCRENKQFFLLKFKGYDDRTAVEPLRGKLLHVSKQDAVKLPEGHYFVFDIIGLAVEDDTGAALGTVTEVLSTGSNDVYVVEQEGLKPLLIPALKSVVQTIDVPGGRMVVKLQEEWE